MKSNEAMVNARDYQLNTLNKAIDLSDSASTGTPPVRIKIGNTYGIHVTSIVDHRVDDRAKPLYYKHRPALADYHKQVHKVDHDPKYALETEIERARRLKRLAEMRQRKVTERRPSMS